MAAFTFVNCDKNKTEEEDTNSDDPIIAGCQLQAISASSNVEGFGIMEKLPGIWNGTVMSPTPL